MKLVKKLITGVLALVVLLVVVLFVALYFINDAVKLGVQKGGTYALGVDTTLKSADVKPFAGSVALAGLDIANPQGFKQPQFFHLGESKTEVSIGSLFKDTIEVPLISLKDVKISLEKDGKGQKNYQVILDNLKKLSKGEKPKEESSGGKKFVVKKLDIEAVNVHLDMVPDAGGVLEFNVPIDAIHLTDIGSAGKPVPMSELTGIVLRAILAAAVDKGGSIIPGDILGDLGSQLEAIGSLKDLGINAVVDVGEGLGKAAEDAAKQVGKLGEGVQKGIEGAGKEIEKKADDLFKNLPKLPGGK